MQWNLSLQTPNRYYMIEECQSFHNKKTFHYMDNLLLHYKVSHKQTLYMYIQSGYPLHNEFKKEEHF
jgi:hypothetical protein